MKTHHKELEWQTRRERIDQHRETLDWQVVPCTEGMHFSSCHSGTVAEYPTANGPADYALIETKSISAPHALNCREVRDLLFALPPLEEQCEIVHRVRQLFVYADSIEECVAVGTAQAERLSQAILAKAFRSALIPARENGREYESASAFLGKACIVSSTGRRMAFTDIHAVPPEQIGTHNGMSELSVLHLTGKQCRRRRGSE